MHSFFRDYKTEVRLAAVLLAMCVALSLVTDSFLTPTNLSSLMNNSAINLIWAVGLLVVLIAGGIDISFAVASSVVQYLAVQALFALGGGNWLVGLVVCGAIGIGLGLVNMVLIQSFRIVTIVVTIATYNAFFGLLMFFSSGRSIYNLPGWMDRPDQHLRIPDRRRLLGRAQSRGRGDGPVRHRHVDPDPAQQYRPPALCLRRQS